MNELIRKKRTPSLFVTVPELLDNLRETYNKPGRNLDEWMDAAAQFRASAQLDWDPGSYPPTVNDPRISESSGLVASPTHDGLVWTVNDSGHTASVFGVSKIEA